MTLQLKRAKGIMHSQQGMASIALSVIGCIDYLAYGTIFMRAMFLLKKKLDVFFPARKARDEPRRVVGGQERFSLAFPPTFGCTPIPVIQYTIQRATYVE